MNEIHEQTSNILPLLLLSSYTFPFKFFVVYHNIDSHVGNNYKDVNLYSNTCQATKVSK